MCNMCVETIVIVYVISMLITYINKHIKSKYHKHKSMLTFKIHTCIMEHNTAAQTQ